MKTMIILTGTLVLGVSLCCAQLRIAQFGAAGHLTWTNAVGNAAYRVEFAPAFKGPYRTLTNVVSTAFTNSIQLGPVPRSSFGFYRVVWTDAPPAAPLGTWEYQGFECSNLVVTGHLTFTATSPISGTWTFGAARSPANMTNHPLGTAQVSNGTIQGSNALELRLGDSFWLTGQMVMDEFRGCWSYTEFRLIILPFGGPGGRTVTYGGTFIAKRSQ